MRIGALALLASTLARAAPTSAPADVVIYGATPAGIAAAIEAARDGLRVALVEPTRHIGGLTTSGLSHTDHRTHEGLTGFFRDFTERVLAHYEQQYGPASPQARASRSGTQGEPHVNERVFEAMLAEHPGVRLHRGRVLAGVETSVGPAGLRRITAATFTRADGSPDAPLRLAPRIVIDATYEGDLMASAGVAYRVGREGRDEHDESLAPAVADNRIQGYNFRLIATRSPALRVPVAQPPGYRREDFLELVPLLHDGRIRQVFGYNEKSIFKAQIPGLPNQKFDINDVSRAPVRLSLPGENLGWPDGDRATRDAIFAAHLRHNVGMLWFLQHDPDVPTAFQAEAREWGWSRDEFADNRHLPWQLYVREARRMNGLRVFTQRDTDPHPGDARSRFHADGVGLGDYGSLNSHGTGHEGPRFGGRHVGEFYQRIAPIQIPYAIMVPRELDNLLVPVALSSSHVGFSALRYEPSWSSTGQAAGIAARLAARDDAAVQAVSPAQIQRALHTSGAATLYVSDISRTHPLFAAVQALGARGGLHGLVSGSPATYGARGRSIGGQYCEAFPGHAFEPTATADAALLARWTNLLPTAVRGEGERALGERPLTRGAAVEIWFRLFERAAADDRLPGSANREPAASVRPATRP